MTYLIRTCTTLLAVAALTFPLGVGLAKKAGAQSAIAVVDTQKVMRDSEAAQSIEKQLKTYREKFHAELTKKEQALREEQKDISDKRTTLAPEELKERAVDFEKKLNETRRFTDNRKRVLEEAYLKAMATLEAKMFEVVQKIASTKGYDLVLSRQSIVVGERSIDITDEVMEEINKSLSHVDLKVEGQ